MFALTAPVAAGQAGRATGSLTIDALVDIKHPSRATWSPDGRTIAFVWDRAGVQNIWVAGASEGSPTAVTSYDSGLIDSLAWTGDGQSLLFARGGDLWRAPRGGGQPTPVWTTPDVESGITISRDGTRAAFERGGDLYVRRLDDGSETRLTNTPAAEANPVWSPDSTRVAFTVASATRREDAPSYSGAKILFTRFDRTTSDVGVVPAAGGSVVFVGQSPATESSPRWLGPTRLALHRVSEDLKTREILAADATTGQATTLHRDVDTKWWSLPGRSGSDPEPSPDGRWVAFVSDRDGWDHLYVAPAAGGTAIQITKGQFEVRAPRWSPDGTRLAFDSNEGPNPGARHVVVASLGGDPAKATQVTATSGRGTNTDAVWAPTGDRLVYQHTDPRNSADFFVAAAQAGAAPRRLTDSLPPSIDRAALVEPRLVRYPSADGSPVPAYLFVPPGLDRSQKHPAIVWIHGDGVNQNYDGWHVERNYAVYYSFHQYLLQRGYVVLAVDYRGSIGYGKAWRQGHYRDLGGKDHEDVAAGAAYLQTLGYVDGSRIGVWGLSYGGFLTLQALTVTPDLFRCGIDVAGVDDWRDWYRDTGGSAWIKGRMGPPAENAELYRRTAPVERVDRIVRPVLVLHGTADVNVPFIESVRLVDALLKADKDVEFMMYPGEFHYFTRAHVLRDAWERAERFFDQHLRGVAGTATGHQPEPRVQSPPPWRWP